MEMSDTANWLFLAGRVLFVVLFAMSGIGHFAARENMVGYAKAKGVPGAAIMVPLTGLLLVACALGVLMGVWMDIAFLGLVVFLLPTAFLMHAFWKETDPMAKMSEQVNFNKNLSLAGASLMLFVVTASHGDHIGMVLGKSLLSW